MEALYRHNFKEEDLFLELEEKLKANGPYLNPKIRLRCVAIKDGENWKSQICYLKGFSKKKTPHICKNIEYKNLLLIEQWFPLNEVSALIKKFKSEAIHLAEKNINLLDSRQSNTIQFNTKEFHAGNGDYSEFPGHLYRSHGNGYSNLSEMLLEHGHPFFTSGYEAIKYWMEIKGLNGNNDARLGSVLIYLPECRARITSNELEEKKVKIGIENNIENKKMKLKGSWKTQNGLIEINEEVSGEYVEFNAPEYADIIEAYLIDEKDNLYDFIKEYSQRASGENSILVKLNELSSDEKVARKAMDDGEGLTIEFKACAFCLEGKKVNEIIETVIAFANASGGKVFVGINDYGFVDGIEKEVYEGKSGNSFDKNEAKKFYAVRLHQRILDVLDEPLPMRIKDLEIDGKLIMIINVPKSETPISDKRNGIFYIRRNASNKKASKEALLQLFATKSQDGILDMSSF